jgi:ribose 5-phosphate isomerase A
VDSIPEKRLAAEAAAALVEDGMHVGLGSGRTAGFFIEALAARRLGVRCVATSPQSERAARDLGLEVDSFDELDRLHIAVDGADQVGPDGWLAKGGGGAHTREKIVAAAADRFIVVASSDKLVEKIDPPVALEVLPFGLHATMSRIGHVALRAGAPPSPDGGVIADYLGRVDDLGALASLLSATPGVVEHGLFPPWLVYEILIGRNGDVERRRPL